MKRIESGKLATALLVAGGVFYGVVQGLGHAQAASIKLMGRAEGCSWSQLLDLNESSDEFDALQESYIKNVKILERDDAFGLIRVTTGERDFWVAARGERMDGPRLMAYLMAEHRWMAHRSRGHVVHKGDVVVDVGAHVGVFTNVALAYGAAKVIMIEPDPVNIEALKRNFVKELADGRVVLVQEGSWSKESTLDLHIGDQNSGMGSLVILSQGKKTVSVRVRKLDDQLKELGIEKVNFIKMDIEGAEREALKGAAAVISASKPTLMLDAYHLPDDRTVLPAVVTGIRPDYILEPGPCEPIKEDPPRVIPHVIYFF